MRTKSIARGKDTSKFSIPKKTTEYPLSLSPSKRPSLTTSYVKPNKGTSSLLNYYV
jgi:hypothetical protein